MGRLGCTAVLLFLVFLAGAEGQGDKSDSKSSKPKGKEDESLFRVEPDRDEVEGLLAMKKALGNPEVLKNWEDGTHPCHDEWFGIECGVDRVRGISLPKQGLEGELSPMLAKVTGLQEISVPENKISGFLPESWASLPFLELVNLQSNQLSGSLPSGWSSMKNVKHMLLDSNKLSGPLPPNWWQLSTLESLSLSGNSIDGSLPGVWKNMKHISIIILSSNKISKTLPESWGSIPNMRILHLGKNKLYGTLPESWGRWEGIEDIELEANNLIGSLPAEWGRWGVLTSLNLRDNNLADQIPEDWSLIFRNAEVDLSENINLCGPLPRASRKIFQDNLRMNVHLDRTNLGANCSSITYKETQALLEFKSVLAASTKGEVLRSWAWAESQACDGEWEDIVCEGDSVVSINLAGHGLSGSISRSLSELSMLKELDLHSNSLTGSLPPEIGHLNNLLRLDLSHNKLGGPLPSNWSSAESLKDIDISFNFVQENLPESWVDLQELRSLNLAHNAIAGLLPESWARMTALETLDISENILTGVLPSSWSAMTSLETLDVSSNVLVGLVPEEWGNVTHPLPVNLKDNQLLCGPIPETYAEELDISGTSLGDPCSTTVRETVPLVSLRSKVSDPTHWLSLWKASSPPCIPGVDSWAGIICNNGHVVGISLKGFGLEGNLPEELSQLTELEVLDVSENKFTGELPESWGALTGLKEVNLSGNHLEGELPRGWSSMKSIQFLDLSKNELSGGIPDEWVELEALTELDLSENNALCNGLPSDLPDTLNVRGREALAACRPRNTPYWLIVIGAVLAGTVLVSLIICVVGSAPKRKLPVRSSDNAIALSSGVKRTKSGTPGGDNPFEISDDWGHRLQGRRARGLSGSEPYPSFS